MSLSDESCHKTKAFLELLLLSQVGDTDVLSPSCPVIPLDFLSVARTALRPWLR